MTEQKIKNQLWQYCLSTVTQQIELTEAAIKQAQQTANNESKSSAGDKHETARALAHLEQERHAQVLRENLLRKKLLQQINVEKANEYVDNGSLVETTAGTFFIAISMGTIALGDAQYRIISLNSPLGQALLDAEPGDEIEFRQKNIVIKNIY